MSVASEMDPGSDMDEPMGSQSKVSIQLYKGKQLLMNGLMIESANEWLT